MKHLSENSPARGLLRKIGAGCACALGLFSAVAHAAPVPTIWYILLENRNFTDNEPSGGSQVYGNPAAPYINSLITPGNPNATYVSYCTAYHNVLSVYNGANPSIHPSEPNYVWMEAGSNLSKADDNEPYGTGLSVNQIHNFYVANPDYSTQNLTGLIQAAGYTWRSYSEETQQQNTVGANFNLGGTLSNAVAPENIWTVPLASFSGSSASYINPYNGTHQYNFACKHTGSLFFSSTNGTSSLTVANTSTSNPEAQYYSPLPDLAADLNNSACAQYNVITPDQFNDMHTALTGSFSYNGHSYSGDLAQVAQGDNFLSIVVPQIMASPQWQAGGAIVIWTDETEGTNQNDFQHTLTEIVISKLAKGNAYASTLNYTHSSDVATMQEIFQVTANTPSGYLNDAANLSNPTPAASVGLQTALPATAPIAGQAAEPPSGYGTGQAQDLSDLFVPGTVPSGIPVVQVSAGGYVLNKRTNVLAQTVTVSNLLSSSISNPVYLEISGLSANTTLKNSAGVAADGNPYVLVSSAGLSVGSAATVTLQFANPASGSVAEILNATTNGTP